MPTVDAVYIHDPKLLLRSSQSFRLHQSTSQQKILSFNGGGLAGVNKTIERLRDIFTKNSRSHLQSGTGMRDIQTEAHVEKDPYIQIHTSIHKHDLYSGCCHTYKHPREQNTHRGDSHDPLASGRGTAQSEHRHQQRLPVGETRREVRTADEEVVVLP